MLRRLFAWSIRGECVFRYEFLLHGTKYSILPALSLDGIVHLEVVENAVTGNDFRRFVQGLLPHMNEWPLANSVLVIDNASIHKVAGIREMVEEHGLHLLYLPAYSPDFNPIDVMAPRGRVADKHLRLILGDLGNCGKVLQVLGTS